MKVDKTLISRLEDLARLQLSAEEKESIMGDMNKILSMMDKLNELNTDNVEPLVYMSDAVNVWREDIVHHPITKEEALLNAPKKDENYIRVAKVIN